MDLLEFRAGNPSIPSDVIVGRIHLLVDRYRKSGVDTREPVRATQTQPPVAQTSQSEQFSSGDQLAQSILHMKQIRGRDFDEPTDQEKANTAAKKSPPKTLFPVEHPPNPGEKNRGVVSAATSERACSNFAQRHARASRLLSGTTLLCMLAVPTYMCAADLAQFVAPFAERIRRLRIVWDATRPYGYMALLRFQTPDDAVLFAMEYDEKLFSEAFGQERCRVLPVERVEYHHATQQRSDFIASLAALNDHRSGDVVEWGEPSSKDEERGRWEEWPTCPVCLDRLDLESIVTGLCNHSLHTTCLARWSDPSCPVCRFVATDMPSAKAACEVCHVQTQLWICLVCGHVGCGRYVQHHALAHYRSTHHVFCMEIQSGRVWDYCSDSYVHRVLLNDPDGKHAVLETPTESEAHASPATTGSRGNATRNTLPSSSNRSVTEHEEEQTQLFAATVASKVDSLSQEYELLLFSQLESQRIWFEAKAAELEDIWSRRVRELEQQLQIYRRSGAPPAEEQCHQSESNEMSLKMLRELNERLLRDASTWRERVERLQRERDELADQVNDLLQHIEAGAKISTKSDAGMSVRVEARRFRRRSKP
jgi:BRCA1-associated protein